MTYEEVNLGFSTADAERPSLEFRDGSLHLRFVNWQGVPISAVLHDTVAFQWTDGENFPPIEEAKREHRDDTTYVVGDSPWLAQCRRRGAAGDAQRHFKLCFNDCGGVLEVLASGVSVLPHTEHPDGGPISN